jgi:dTDP-glucose pyrophosphorylase
MSYLNIVIPAAGNGSRFVTVGYRKPKPFIDVNGKSMIETVMDNLSILNAKYFIIVKPEYLEKEKEAVDRIKQTYDVTFVSLEKNQTTEGAVCTVLHTRKYINNDDMLMLANSDQFVDFDIKKFIQDLQDRNLDASILTFKDKERNPKWSFAKVGSDELVEKVAEKVVISDQATVGIYLYKHGKIFVDATIDMIVRNDRFNNEFYVCPTYNYVIKNGYKVGVYEIPQESMHGLGTPEDLEGYLEFIKN